MHVSLSLYGWCWQLAVGRVVLFLGGFIYVFFWNYVAWSYRVMCEVIRIVRDPLEQTAKHTIMILCPQNLTHLYGYGELEFGRKENPSQRAFNWAPLSTSLSLLTLQYTCVTSKENLLSFLNSISQMLSSPPWHCHLFFLFFFFFQFFGG